VSQGPPGLFQTAEYARALFLAAGADEAIAEEMLAVRLERQAILDSFLADMKAGQHDLV
jgi:hypothetical protein